MAINLHPGQSEVFSDIFVKKACRFPVVCCSRGWGKSFMAGASAATAVVELLHLPANVPNKNVYIIAPTYDQVTDIYYPLLNYDLGLEQYAIKSSRDAGRFWFPNNVELRLLSYEAVERMRGKGAYFVVWDEVSSCTRGLDPKNAWQGVIQPCIITRWSEQRARAYNARSAGRALIISTPKGYNFFHEMSTYEEVDPKWKFYHYDYTKSPYLDMSEIEALRHKLDPVEFASEYLASFAESGNNVFYMFDRKVHVQAALPDFLPPENGYRGEDVHVAIDFNVGLQCSTASAIRGDQVHILEEFKGHSDTEVLAQVLVNRFKGHRIFAYPDPSGRARKTSAPVGRTDFSILESYGIKCLAHSRAPSIVDSVACVNRKLKTAAGDVGMFIHPRCQGAVQSLERTKWVDNKPDTAAIDKKEGVEHFSDGIRYLCEFKFPIRSGQKPVSRGFNF